MSTSCLSLTARNELNESHCKPGQQKSDKGERGRFVGSMLTEQEKVRTEGIYAKEGSQSHFPHNNGKSKQRPTPQCRTNIWQDHLRDNDDPAGPYAFRRCGEGATIHGAHHGVYSAIRGW